jgi:hypothetical protein
LKDPLDFNSGGSAASVRSGLASLKSCIDVIESKAAAVRSFISTELVDPIHAVMTTASSALSKVVGVVTEARGIVTAEANQFIGIASDLSLLGRNVFNTYNAITNLPDSIAHEVSTIAGAFNNAFCVLKNAFKKVQEYPDYDPLYGASNCSSTVGGSPISPLLGTNPWQVILPSSPLVASVTPDARANIDALKATDPVLAPMSSTELGSRTSAAISGISLSWV